jgi:hypothetical protein
VDICQPKQTTTTNKPTTLNNNNNNNNNRETHYILIQKTSGMGHLTIISNSKKLTPENVKWQIGKECKNINSVLY